MKINRDLASDGPRHFRNFRPKMIRLRGTLPRQRRKNYRYLRLRRTPRFARCLRHSAQIRLQRENDRRSKNELGSVARPARHENPCSLANFVPWHRHL